MGEQAVNLAWVIVTTLFIYAMGLLVAHSRGWASGLCWPGTVVRSEPYGGAVCRIRGRIVRKGKVTP